MTKASTSSFLDHSGDAGFRAWGLEFSTQTGVVGLVQTADTGQINWTTVTRPGINTAGGYEIWRFADSTLFLKIEYGTNASAASPAMWITVGTGSNGTGTLTGQLSTRNLFVSAAVPASTVTNYTSRWCAIADAFSVTWKEISMGATLNGGYLVIGKTCDGTGTSTTTGFAVIRDSSASGTISKQSVRIVATATTYNDVSTDITVIGDPGASSLTAGGSQQAYEISVNIPDVQPFCYACTVLISEAARGSTLVVAMVGSTTRTYISPGQISANTYGAGLNTGRYTCAMIWE